MGWSESFLIREGTIVKKSCTHRLKHIWICILARKPSWVDQRVFWELSEKKNIDDRNWKGAITIWFLNSSYSVNSVLYRSLIRKNSKLGRSYRALSPQLNSIVTRTRSTSQTSICPRSQRCRASSSRPVASLTRAIHPATLFQKPIPIIYTSY